MHVDGKRNAAKADQAIRSSFSFNVYLPLSVRCQCGWASAALNAACPRQPFEEIIGVA